MLHNVIINIFCGTVSFPKFFLLIALSYDKSLQEGFRGLEIDFHLVYQFME